MDIQEFDAMSIDEIKAFQEKNRKKLEETRAKIKEQKSQTRRWIARGQMLEEIMLGSKDMEDDELLQRLCDLIYTK